MVCNICGGTAFSVTEYRAGNDGACRAPAFSCRGCGAIHLREEVASNDEERDSVKIAIAMRASVGNEPRRAPGPDLHKAETPSTVRIKVR